MSIKEILMTVLAAAVMNNLVFTRFLGISQAVCSGREKYLGPAVTLVMLLSSAAAVPVTALLSTAGLEAFNTFVFALIILAVSWILELICGKALKLSFPLVVLNSAVLGLLLNNAASAQNLTGALLSALGAGLGFWLALVLFSSLRLKLSNPDIPEVFRGFPIQLLAAAIISMALMAF